MVFYEPIQNKKPLILLSIQGLWYCMNFMNQYQRREWDSNPRYPFGVHTLSKRAPSATRTSLLVIICFYFPLFDRLIQKLLTRPSAAVTRTSVPGIRGAKIEMFVPPAIVIIEFSKYAF